MKKVYICGVVASGKGLLRPLLDGHPNIITCPLQGVGQSLLTSNFIEHCKRERLLSSKILYAQPGFKKIYLQNEDCRIEIGISDLILFILKNDSIGALLENAIAKIIAVGSSQENQRFIKFDFNFFNFIESYIQEISNIGEFSSIEHLQDTLYHNLIKNWKNKYSSYSEDGCFVESSTNGFGPIENIIKNNSNRKIIIVMRDPVALSYTNTERIRRKFNSYQPPEHYRKKFFYKYVYNPYDATLYSRGFIDRVRKFRCDAYNTARQDKDIYIVQFEDLIFNTKDTMDKIAAFLEIEPHDILYKATLNGEYLEDESINFTNKINDDPYQVLSRRQIEILEQLYGERTSINSSTYNSVTRIMVFKWKIFYKLIKLRNVVNLLK